MRERVGDAVVPPGQPTVIGEPPQEGTRQIERGVGEEERQLAWVLASLVVHREDVPHLVIRVKLARGASGGHLCGKNDALVSRNQ